MATQTNNPGKGVLVGATGVAAYRLIKANGQYCQDDSSSDFIGVTQEPRSPGQIVPVRFVTAGSCIMTGATGITAGDVVYKGADGTVGKTDTNARVGIALTTV